MVSNLLNMDKSSLQTEAELDRSDPAEKSGGLMGDESSAPQWLTWARELQAIAQTSLHYVENDYQRQRRKSVV